MPDPDQIPYVNLIKRLDTPDEWRDVPIIGDLVDAGNAVINFVESDCRPDWSVYVETLFPALGEAVLVLLTFGLDDVLRGYARPAGGRGFGGLGRASRRQRVPTKAQRARGLLRGGIPEIGDEIGKRLPGATIVQGRNVGNAERWLWRVDGLAQRGLFYWMIADVTSDFIVNWTTAIMSSEECFGMETAGFTRSMTIAQFLGAGGWGAIELDSLDEEYGPLTSSSIGIALPDPYAGYLSATFDVRSLDGSAGCSGQVAIRNNSTGSILNPSPLMVIPEGPGTVEMAASAYCLPGNSYSWVARFEGKSGSLRNGEAVGLFQGPQHP